MNCLKHPKYKVGAPPELSCKVCCKLFIDHVNKGDKEVKNNKYRVFEHLGSDEVLLKVVNSLDAAIEYRDNLWAEDGSACLEIRDAQNKEVDKNWSEQYSGFEILRIHATRFRVVDPRYGDCFFQDLADARYYIDKSIVRTHKPSLPSNVVSIFGYKKAEKVQPVDTSNSFAVRMADKVKADRKANNAQVIKDLKNNKKGAIS